MKKMFKMKSALMSGLLLTLLMLFSACEHESGTLPDPADEGDILANAGELHNQMVDYYYTHRKDRSTSPEGVYTEMLDLSSAYLVSIGYDASSVEKVRQAVNEKCGPDLLKSTSEGKFSLDPGTFIQQLRTTGLYSNHFLNSINEILQLGENNADKQTIRRHVNSAFTGIRFMHPKDREGQQLFIKIFNSSFQFWESYYGSNLKDAQLKDSSWVIINDAIGGILGLVFGPVGSIVTGTVFSVGTNEEINR
jgi:hypothetical protein